MLTWLWACLPFDLEPVAQPLADVPARPRLPPKLEPRWSSHEHCRTSALRERVQRRDPDKEGWRRIRGDLDGKRGSDVLRVLVEESGGVSANYVELTLDGRPKLTMSMTLKLGAITQTLAFPDNATNDEITVIENALFGTMCNHPDPSLQLLIDGEVRWIDGPPVLPPYYAMREDGQWRTYVGDAHESKGRLPVTYPVPLAARDALKVMATAHGVIAQRADTHSWLFVSREHASLRWPSELSARILSNGAAVEITRYPTTMDEIDKPIVVVQPL